MWWVTFFVGCVEGVPAPADSGSVDVTVCVSGQEASDGGCVPAGCGPDAYGGATDGVFVLPGGQGEGSRDAPFGTIAEGLASGAAVVNVGAPADGAVYDEAIVLDHQVDGVSIVGRCPDLVRVSGVGAEAGIETSGSSSDTWSVAGVTIAEPGGLGVSARVGTLTLSEVVVQGASAVGVVVWTGTLAVAGVQVLDTRPDADGLLGTGVEVLGGTLAGSGLTIVEAVGQGLRVDAFGVADLDGLVVTDVRAGDAAGFGVYALDGASVTVRGCEVARTDAMGINVGGKDGGTTARFTDCTVRDAHTTGVYAFGPGTTLTYSGEVSGTLPYTRTQFGVGLAADLGASVDADVHVHDNDGPGVAAIGAGTTVSVVGEVADNLLVGAYALDGATLVFDGVEVHGTRVAGEDGGYGVIVEQGATGTLRGGRVWDNEGSGLWVGVAGDGPATLTVIETAVDDTLPAVSSLGFGASVADGGLLDLQGATFAGNHQGGVVATGTGEARLSGVTITGTKKALGADYEVAVGLGCQDGATLVADGVRVEGTEGPGVVVVSGCVATLTDPFVADNAYAGIVLGSGTLTVNGGEVRGTTADPGKGGGVGLLGQRDDTVPRLLLADVTLVDNAAGGLVLLDGGAWELVGGTLAGATPEDRGGVHLLGYAVMAFGSGAWDGDQGLRVDGSVLTDAGGTAVLLHGGAATLSGVSWGEVGTEFPADPALVQQGCTDTTPRVDPGDAPSARICDGADVVTGTVSRFVGEFGEAEVVDF